MTTGPTVVLIGAPGAGKTTVGRALARRLGVGFVDTDDVISERAGRSIADIFIEDGEPVFRRMERDVVLASLTEADAVVSLGGGAVMNADIREALSHHRVVWLQVSVAQAAARVGLTGARPLLMGNVRGQLITLLEERTQFYAQVSDIVVETDNRTVEHIVEDIIAGIVAGMDDRAGPK